MDVDDPRITPTNKRLRWRVDLCAFVDEHGEIYETEHQIEARGPKPRQPPFEDKPIDGYVQIGPTSYERIGPGPDFRDVWQAQFRPALGAADRAPTEPQLRGVMGAVTVLVGDCATATAHELLNAFGCTDADVERIFRLCREGRWRDGGVPFLREVQKR